MDKLMDEKVNVWDVIDTYFRDEPYYKSQHQIDSFDEFLLFVSIFSISFVGTYLSKDTQPRYYNWRCYCIE